MTDTSSHPAGPDYPQGSPAADVDEVVRRRRTGGTLRAAAKRARHELDAAELTVAGGDTVRIICVVDVEQWLEGLAIRAENGEPVP
jgi:hypothetical protein